MLSSLHILLQHCLRRRSFRPVTLLSCKLCELANIGYSNLKMELGFDWFYILRDCTLLDDDCFYGKLEPVICTTEKRTLRLTHQNVDDKTFVVDICH